MTEVVIQLTLVVIGAAAKAVADTLSHHYNKSIFLGLDDSFWKKSKSSERKYTLPWWIPDAVSDAWHIANTIMIFALIAGIVVSNPMNHVWWSWLAYYGLLGLTWNGVFNLLHDKLLIKD